MSKRRKKKRAKTLALWRKKELYLKFSLHSNAFKLNISWDRREISEEIWVAEDTCKGREREKQSRKCLTQTQQWLLLFDFCTLGISIHNFPLIRKNLLVVVVMSFVIFSFFLIFMPELFLFSSTLLISLHTHTNEKVKHDDTTRKAFSCDLVEVFPFHYFDIRISNIYNIRVEVSKILSGKIANVSLYSSISLRIYVFFVFRAGSFFRYAIFHFVILLLRYCP